MADYSSNSAYQAYYQLHWFRPAGNLLSQYLLFALFKLLGPSAAERIFLTTYMALFGLAFHFLLRTLKPDAQWFSLFAFLFASNYFLYMGFWNFCLSIPLVLLMLAYSVRHQQRWNLWSLCVMAAGGFTIYLAHVLSWFIFAFAVALLPLRLRNLNRSFFRPYLLSLATLVPVALLWILYSLSSHETDVCPPEPSLRQRLWQLYSAPFLNGFVPSDHLLAIGFVGFLVLLSALALVPACRNWRLSYSHDRLLTRAAPSEFRSRDRPGAVEGGSRALPFLVLSALYGIVTVLAPNCIGSGSYIPMRVSLYAWMFLAIWLALQNWPGWIARLVPAIVCILAAAALIARYPAYAKWSGVLTEFTSLQNQVRAEATILPVILHVEPQGPDPLFHAAGLLFAKGIVNLDNYEASTDYFSTTFRPQRSPFPTLGTRAQLEAVPPAFNIARYEQSTAGRVDYILVEDAPGSTEPWPEVHLYPTQLSGFRLVTVSHPTGRFRLYGRVTR